MSQMTKFRIAGLLLIAGLLFMTGCGSEKNADSPFDVDDDQHVAGWLPAGHKTAALADETACGECHGSDYSGGTSKISCTICHLGGVNSVHPLDWGTSIDSTHSTYVDTNGNTSCANISCHGTNLGGVADSGPSCMSCHLGGTTSFHPASFGTGSQVIPNHGAYVLTNGTSGCATAACHGSNLEGGVGPSCTSCHVNGAPTTLTGCTSCHDTPPTGTTYPNISGAHAAHNALPNVTSVCDTCHNGGGAGTTNHNTGTVYTRFLSSYNAKSGMATYDAAAGTCSKVSCHGGQTTPVWRTGTIDVVSQCTSCHAFGTTEYNSYNGGGHYIHVFFENITCLVCHDPAKLSQNHLTTLNTSTLEGPASATIAAYVNYNPVTQTCSSMGCHVTRVW